MKKIFTVLIAALIMVSAFLSNNFVSAAEKVTLKEYTYKIDAGWNGYGEIYCSGVKYNNKTYLKIRNNNDYVALMDTETGALVTPYVYSIMRFGEYSDLVVFYNEDGTARLYDLENNKEVLTFTEKNGLMYGGHFSPNGGFVYLDDNQLHFVSNSGEIGNAININHESYVSDYSHLITWSYLGEGLFQLGVGNSYGLNKTIGVVNESGQVVAYVDAVGSFIDGIAIASKNGKYGLIDTNGSLIVPYEYDKLEYEYSLESYVGVKNGLYYQMDTYGNSISTFYPNYDLYDVVYEYIGYGMAVVYNKNGSMYMYDWKYGLVDSEGNYIIPIENSSISVSGFWGENLCGIGIYHDRNSANPDYGYINKNAKVAVPFEYEGGSAFSEGYASVQKDGKYGFIDESGTVKIPFEYESADAFSEGLAGVCKNDKWGFINKNGETVIPFMYSYADAFNNGSAYVWTMNDERIIIDKYNNIIPDNEQPKYSLTEWVEEGKTHNGEIRINATGEIVDISDSNLLPVIIGEKGDIIVGFSSDFTKAYRIIIAEESEEIPEITNFTADITENYATVNISVANVTEKSAVYAAVYDSNNKMEHLVKVNLYNNSAAVIMPLKAGNKKIFKLFVWDKLNLNPSCESERYEAIR